MSRIARWFDGLSDKAFRRVVYGLLGLAGLFSVALAVAVVAGVLDGRHARSRGILMGHPAMCAAMRSPGLMGCRFAGIRCLFSSRCGRARHAVAGRDRCNGFGYARPSQACFCSAASSSRCSSGGIIARGMRNGCGPGHRTRMVYAELSNGLGHIKGASGRLPALWCNASGAAVERP